MITYANTVPWAAQYWAPPQQLQLLLVVVGDLAVLRHAPGADTPPPFKLNVTHLLWGTLRWVASLSVWQ
jgi:hypothetical protein